MIDVRLLDPGTGLRTSVVPDEKSGKGALLVATVPYKEYNNKPLFFTNPVYGREMAQSIEASSAYEGIHDGGDTSLWSASNVSSTYFNFNSATNPYSGTYSIYGGAKAYGTKEAEFNKGSFIDLSNYVNISFWLYISKDVGAFYALSIYGWDSTVDNLVGSEIYITNYADSGLTGQWQYISIPLSDMALRGFSVDAFRLKYTDSYNHLEFYIDELQLEESGSSLTYDIEPERGTLLHLNAFNFFFADSTYDASGSYTMPSIPYNSFFNTGPLTVGLNYNRIQNIVTMQSFIFKGLNDILMQPHTYIVGNGFDGSTAWLSITMDFTTPIILDPLRKDKMEFIVSDDMSGLETFIISASAKEEYI